MPIDLQEYASVDAIFEMMQRSQTAYELFFNNTTRHKNKLFLICPTSHVEVFIKKHFDGNVHFLTCLGTVLHPGDEDFVWQLKEYIETHQIEEICLIQDLSSPFLKNVLQKKQAQTYVEDYLQSTYQQYEKHVAALHRFARKKECLATLNLRKQSQVIKYNLTQIDGLPATVQIRAFTYQPKKRLFTEISLTNNYKTNY